MEYYNLVFGFDALERAPVAVAVAVVNLIPIPLHSLQRNRLACFHSSPFPSSFTLLLRRLL